MPQRPGADGFGAAGGRLRGGGAATPPRPLPPSPNPIGLSPPPQDTPSRSGLGRFPRRGPLRLLRGPASPPPRPSPQPDSPREYRDLGDSRSRSALSNEMKSEGIAARPSPARGQREGGERRWRRHLLSGTADTEPGAARRGRLPLPPPRGQ